MAELQQPNIVGNFLAAYSSGLERQQQQQDAAYQRQRQAKADDRLDQQFQWQMDDRQIAAARERADRIAAVAQMSDTPEKWAVNVPAVMQQLGIDGPAPDFSTREAKIAEALGLKDMLDLEFKNREAARQDRVANANIAQSYAAIRASDRQGRGGGGSGVLNNAMQRAQLAQAFGIDPASPAGQKFALTGQLPAPLSATDKKAVLEADQMARATKEGLGALRQARVLSGKASQGWGANTISQGLSLLGDETAINTLDFDNIIKSNVLPQLKVIFGGAPTEGERAILLELQGSSSLSRENRQRILGRAIKAAEDRLQFYSSQAQDLRGGTYYSPTRGQQPAAQSQTAPAAAKKKWTTPEGFTIEEVD